MSKISKIHARQILDSRGNPTVEADVLLETGEMGRASVPSGASTGEFEAVELRDGNSDFYGGKSVLKAVENVNHKISPAVIGHDSARQREIDQLMIDLDGTANKSNLGANAILAVSMAVAVAHAKHLNRPLYLYLNEFSEKFSGQLSLPVPMMNIMNGGKHAIGASDFQEYMILPDKPGISFSERLRYGVEVFHSLKKILQDLGFQTSVGDEGGFAPSLESNIKPLDLIIEAVEKVGYKPGEDISIAMDVASSEFYKASSNEYDLAAEGRVLSKDEFFNYYNQMIEKYPIKSIEDVLDENDFEGWADFTDRFGSRIQIVGDDFYVTNVERLKKGIDMRASNSILIKLNQIGTLTETVDAVNLAQQNNFTAVVSHRSGETEDTFISDLCVGMNTGQIKTGSLSRTDRVAKYNRLLRIEEEL